MKITIIFYVWGELRWLLTPMLLSLKRHWPEMTEEDLIIISESPIYSPIEAENIVYPKITNNWSSAIKTALNEIKTDIVFLFNVDFFCLSQIDTKKLKTFIEYLMTDNNILQGYVFDNPRTSREIFLKYHKFVKKYNGLRIVKCRHWKDCSIEDGGIVAPLFKRELIIDLLRPNLSIQDAEQNLIQDVFKTDFYGVTTDPGLFRMVELHTNGAGQYWRLEHLDEQDQKLIQQYKPESVKFK